MSCRNLSLSLAGLLALASTSCSWFDDDDVAVAPAPAAYGDVPQVTPAGQAPAPAGSAYGYGATGYTAPGAAAAVPAAPVTPPANEQYVQHTIVAGDSLWKLANQYGTSVTRIQQVNQMTSDKILAGATLIIPTTSPPAGAAIVPAPAAPATPAAPVAPTTTAPVTPSATNPVVQPLTPVPAPVEREPIAVPRPSTGF